ncbi:DUF3369 domain-containing protein [Alteromonas sp. a30]|uniref:DUF3369 domain-containing protein n=1 Tax=Alteromonas sp. a30 TaxID=2730917 RepID=UPI0022807F69|nr:DUF3369 domain-containing protein [Alteromonas sp. a30]MCY7295596.1 DUF3369 domain-containing protein [Alteromonas sp. a30]
MSNPLFANQKSIQVDNSSVVNRANYSPLKVLIIDDEPEVHRVTDLALKRFKFEGNSVEFLHAYSAKEAESVFEDNPDIALALVDVVMESDHAGLDLVHYVRTVLDNHTCRLVLRTGQPGQAPEHEVIEKYDINDYKEKTELTSQKLKTLLYSALRSHRDIKTIESHRKGLRQVIESTTSMLKPNSMNEFASAVLKEIMNILQIDSTALYCSTFGSHEDGVSQAKVLAVTGALGSVLNGGMELLPDDVKRLFDQALRDRKSLHSDKGYVFYTQTDSGFENLLFIGLHESLTDTQRELLEIYCIHVSLTYEILMKSEEIIDTQRELVYLLGDAVEMRSKETGAHVKRVSLVCYELAKLANLHEKEALELKRASPLHDLGKVAIPDGILHKPSKLNESEWEIMKSHAQVGYDILQKSARPILKKAAEISLTHHEKWDGSGYPQGLSGTDIPLSGRITAIADVFDALGSARCYKREWSREQIKSELTAQSGKHFDPDLVKLLVNNFDTFWKIRQQNPD